MHIDSSFFGHKNARDVDIPRRKCYNVVAEYMSFLMGRESRHSSAEALFYW